LPPAEHILVIASILLLISVLASMLSERLSIPALLIFLSIGMLAGSEGFGGIQFDDPWMVQFLGVIALSFILFDGGLSTHWHSVRPVLWKGLTLSTLGVLLTALLLGGFASLVLGFSFLHGALLGSIVSSTDAAAVFAILRSRNVSLKGQLKPLLELESGSNDPMAAFLTLGFIQLLTVPQSSIFDLVPMFVQQMVVGGVLGYAFGKGMIYTVNRVRLGYDGLYPVLTMAMVTLAYGLTVSFGGNGFLAVYIAAIVMGNSDFIHKQSLKRFHEGLAWLMQIVMFLALGLLVFPSHVFQIVPVGLLIAAFLMLVARPISVYATLHFFKVSAREKALISWVGLRGAVPIILATFPLLAGIPQAELFFNIVFFVVITSVLTQGTLLTQVAKWLKVDAPIFKRAPSPLEYMPTGKSRNDMIEIPVPEDSPIVGKQIVDLGLPNDVLIVLINREDEFIVPRGNTVLQPEDILLVLVDKDDINEVCEIVKTCPTI
jgi:cell volume regulation protein A